MQIQNLSELSVVAWRPVLRAALDAWREGDWVGLAEGPLAQTGLVLDCLLTGEAQTPDARARALLAVLGWGIERLRPAGKPSWVAQPWQAYNVLHYFYAEGMRVSELARKLHVAESSIHETMRPAALDALATLLRAELRDPQAHTERQWVYVAGRYASRPQAEQRLLRAAALFRRPVPPTLLAALVGLAETPLGWANVLARVLASGWLMAENENAAVMAHPQARPYLLTQLTPAEQRTWHTAAGEHYAAQGQVWEAVEHWRVAEAFDAAAALILAQANALLNDFQAARLREVLAGFRPNQVTPTHWTRLCLLNGQLAEMLHEVPTALRAYAQALGGAPEITLKAEAHFRYAQTLRATDVTQALTHFARCIELLNPVEPRPTFWALAWIETAWCQMAEQHALPAARAALDQAATVAAQLSLEVQMRLANALGEWWYHQRDFAQAIAHHHQAWLLALEVRDPEMQLASAYNLGSIYAEHGQPQHSLRYLEQGLALAQQQGNKRLLGLFHKGIGEYYFWLGEDAEAVRYYRVAYSVFQALDHPNWQRAACYDLAEALARQGQWEAARHYFETGVGLAHRLPGTTHLAEFEALARQYPRLRHAVKFTRRQRRILTYAQKQGEFTSAALARQLRLSKEQTLRELNTLVAGQHLARTGRGKGTRYLPLALR